MSILRRSASSPLIHVVGARAVTFPITIVCGLLWLRLVIGHLGPEEYAFVALLVGLQFLLNFLDFGTSAPVLEAAGRYRAHKDPEILGRALGAAWRTVLAGNLLLLTGALGLLVIGAWGPILGFPDRAYEAGLAVALLLTVNALVRPLSLSTALVAGLGRPAVATWSQALTGLSSLAMLAILLELHSAVTLIIITPLAGQLVAYSVPFLLSMRAVPGLMGASLRGMLRGSLRDRQLRRLAVPMLLIQAIGPLNDQLDRVILSHVSTVEALAVYSLGAQLLVSAESLVTALIPALWAEFAELRSRGGPRAAVSRSFWYLRRLWIVGLLFGAAFCLLSRILSPLISDGQLHLPWSFCAVLGTGLALSVVSVVLGIGLTDHRSLRLQPLLLSLTTAINLALTVFLGARLGALGPALASLIATLIHLPLLFLLARLRLRDDGWGNENRAGMGPVESLASQRRE